MITQAIYDYHRVFKMDIDLAKCCSYFEKLTSSNLKDISKFINKPNFHKVLALLDKSKVHSF